jgi:hypothetical protein
VGLSSLISETEWQIGMILQPLIIPQPISKLIQGRVTDALLQRINRTSDCFNYQEEILANLFPRGYRG